MWHHYPRSGPTVTKNAKLKHVESMSIAMHAYTYLLAANTCAKRGSHVPLHLFRDREPSLTRQKLPLIPSAHFCLHAGQGQTSIGPKSQKSDGKVPGRLYLVSGLKPSEKYWSIGMIIPNIWENKTCSKAQTRYGYDVSMCFHMFSASERGPNMSQLHKLWIPWKMAFHRRTTGRQLGHFAWQVPP